MPRDHIMSSYWSENERAFKARAALLSKWLRPKKKKKTRRRRAVCGLGRRLYCSVESFKLHSFEFYQITDYQGLHVLNLKKKIYEHWSRTPLKSTIQHNTAYIDFNSM